MRNIYSFNLSHLGMQIMSNKLKILVLWLAVIPTAALGFILGALVANILFKFQGWFIGVNPGSGFEKINDWIISSAIGAGACVYFGSKMAPSHRKIVSMSLSAVIVSVCTLTIISAISTNKDVIWSIFGSLAAVLTSGSIVYGFFEEGDDFTLSK